MFLKKKKKKNFKVMIGSQIIKQTIKLEILINKQNSATITPSLKKKKKKTT